jgi:hypothetical protein
MLCLVDIPLPINLYSTQLVLSSAILFNIPADLGQSFVENPDTSITVPILGTI